jgi:hypothetical protein
MVCEHGESLPAASYAWVLVLDLGVHLRGLDEASHAARLGEASGEDAVAGEAWREYRLIRDAARDPDELLAEGIALSERAIELAVSGRATR